MQCIRAFVGQQPDELSLEKADIILVHQQSTDRKATTFPISSGRGVCLLKIWLHLHCFVFLCSSDWVEGTRLSDRHRGWVPASHLETITNSLVRQHNLEDALKVSTATAAV